MTVLPVLFVIALPPLVLFGCNKKKAAIKSSKQFATLTDSKETQDPTEKVSRPPIIAAVLSSDLNRNANLLLGLENNVSVDGSKAFDDIGTGEEDPLKSEVQPSKVAANEVNKSRQTGIVPVPDNPDAKQTGRKMAAAMAVKKVETAPLESPIQAVPKTPMSNALLEANAMELKWNEKNSTQNFNLTNKGPKSLAIKIKVSNNAIYQVDPVIKILKPGKSMPIHVTRMPGQFNNDRVIVEYIEGDGDAVAIWAANRATPQTLTIRQLP